MVVTSVTSRNRKKENSTNTGLYSLRMDSNMRVQGLWRILVVTLVTIGAHSKRMGSRLHEVDVSHKQRFFCHQGVVTRW